MNQIFKLYKLQLNESVGNLKVLRSSKWVFKILSTAIITLLLLFLVFKLVFELLKFKGIFINQDLMTVVLVILQLITFILAIPLVTNNLFYNKDNELLLSMPAKHEHVFISKILLIYTYEIFVNIVLVIPIFFAYGEYMGYNIGYYMITFIMSFILPIYPMLLASIVASPIMLVTKKLKNNFKIMIPVIIGVSIAAFSAYIFVISKIVGFLGKYQETLEFIPKINNVIKDFANISWIYKKFIGTMTFDSGFMGTLLIFIGILIVLGVACFYILKFSYFKVLSNNLEGSGKAYENKSQNFEPSSQVNAIIKKDVKTVFRSTGYVFQFFIYAFLMPFIAYLYNSLLLTMEIESVGKKMVVGANFLLILIVALLCNTISATSISREGGNFYLMKITPVPYKKQIFAKVFFNFVANEIAIFITCVVVAITSNVAILNCILIFITVSIVSLAHILWSISLDIKNPTLDWYDSSEINKTSKNVGNSLLTGIISSLIIGVIGMFFFYAIGYALTWFLVLLISIIYLVARLFLLYIRMDYYFRKMEA